MNRRPRTLLRFLVSGVFQYETARPCQEGFLPQTFSGRNRQMNEPLLDNATKVVMGLKEKFLRARNKLISSPNNSNEDPWGQVVDLLRLATARDYTNANAFEIDRAHVGALTVESLIHNFIGKGYHSTLEEEVSAHAKIVSDPKIIFDVGANQGNWSIAALKRFPNARVFAFEPSSNHAQTLERLKNEFGNRLTIINEGASNTIGRAVLHKDADGSGLASLHERELDRYNIKLDKKEDIALTTIDYICKIHEIEKVDIIKIDVEGHEMKVLEGAVGILDTATSVQFEFGGTMLDSHYYFKDFYEFFSKKGFEIYRICRYGFCPVLRYFEHHESFDGANYIAYRRNS
jgi:FkbM family methyltransferase